MMQQEFSRHHRLFGCGLVSLLALVWLGACASATRNTLAQDLAWERWGQCSSKYPTVRLKEIRTDGQIWFQAEGGSDFSSTRYYVVKSGQRREIFWRADDFALHLDKLDGEIELRRWPLNYRTPWPFRPGKAWDVKTTEFRPKERQTTDVHNTCRVESEETVRVPAGEFLSVRIVCRDARTEKVRSEIWYAPRVKHWVRQRSHLDYGVQERELIGYRVD